MARKIGYLVDVETGCYLCFTNVLDRYGYPQIRMNGRIRNVHRVLYESKYGEIPKGKVVRHKCDNPLCVNVSHLELGSHGDNMRDMVLRGRSCKGCKNGRAKLNEDIVIEMRKSSLNNSQLAKLYNVAPSTVRLVRKRKLWNHIS